MITRLVPRPLPPVVPSLPRLLVSSPIRLVLVVGAVTLWLVDQPRGGALLPRLNSYICEAPSWRLHDSVTVILILNL